MVWRGDQLIKEARLSFRKYPLRQLGDGSDPAFCRSIKPQAVLEQSPSFRWGYFKMSKQRLCVGRT